MPYIKGHRLVSGFAISIAVALLSMVIGDIPIPVPWVLSVPATLNLIVPIALVWAHALCHESPLVYWEENGQRNFWPQAAVATTVLLLPTLFIGVNAYTYLAVYYLLGRWFSACGVIALLGAWAGFQPSINGCVEGTAWWWLTLNLSPSSPALSADALVVLLLAVVIGLGPLRKRVSAQVAKGGV